MTNLKLVGCGVLSTRRQSLKYKTRHLYDGSSWLSFFLSRYFSRPLVQCFSFCMSCIPTVCMSVCIFLVIFVVVVVLKMKTDIQKDYKNLDDESEALGRDTRQHTS